MKTRKTYGRIAAAGLCLLLALSLTACGSMDKGMDAEHGNLADVILGGSTILGESQFSSVTGDQGTYLENPFVSAQTQPISTFSADVDTASYGLFRKLVNSGYSLEELKKQSRSFRTEEMVNYFSYDYPLPKEGEVFGHGAEIVPAPWNENTYLMVLGLTTEALAEKGANNLVCLIDVSGSMAAADKLPLLKNAFATLVTFLDERDTVSIVTYSGRETVVLDGVSGDRDEEILTAVRSLLASGSTNGQSGLQKAYELAGKHRLENGNNRIILASDGDLNVGISSPEELKEYVCAKRGEGIYLSVMGFGTGNYRDDTMSALAQNGNGVYYYIDSAAEAERVMGSDLLSTLYTVARDVKLQVRFDPTLVEEYRLIGYENRLLETEDFDDDQKDGGEVGAGHSLTVCYELKLKADALEAAAPESPIGILSIRYQPPEGGDSALREHPLTKEQITSTPSEDAAFVSAVIQTAMLLHDSEYFEREVTVAELLTELTALDLSADWEKQEFVSLLQRLA